MARAVVEIAVLASACIAGPGYSAEIPHRAALSVAAEPTAGSMLPVALPSFRTLDESAILPSVSPQATSAQSGLSTVSPTAFLEPTSSPLPTDSPGGQQIGGLATKPPSAHTIDGIPNHPTDQGDEQAADLGVIEFDSGETLPGDPAIEANQTPYSARPDVLRLSGRKLPKAYNGWDQIKKAQLEALAEILELHPTDEIFFLARDSEYLYDLGRVLLAGSGDSKRIHLINVSRANMRAPHLLDYLIQEGLIPSEIALGKKVLLVDTGFSGTIPRVIAERLPEPARGNIRAKLLASNNAIHGSTRAFLQKLNPTAAAFAPAEMHGTLIAYEHMPRYTPRAEDFQRISGRWEPVGSETSASDGIIDPIQAGAFMRDLILFGKRSRDDFENLRKVWKTFKESRSKMELLSRLKAHLIQDKTMGEARVRDFLEHLALEKSPLTVGPEEIGLKPIEFELGNKFALMEMFPQWKPVLENPETEVPKLVAAKDYQTLGNLIDVVRDYEIDHIIAGALEGDVTPQSASLLDAMIKKGSVDRKIAQFAVRAPWSDEHPEVARALIDKGTEDVLVLAHLSASSRNHAGLLEAMIDRKSPSAPSGPISVNLKSEIMRKLDDPMWRDHPSHLIWVTKLLESAAERERPRGSN